MSALVRMKSSRRIIPRVPSLPAGHLLLAEISNPTESANTKVVAGIVGHGGKIRAATFSLRRRSLSTAKSKLNWPYRGETFSQSPNCQPYTSGRPDLQCWFWNCGLEILANCLASPKVESRGQYALGFLAAQAQLNFDDGVWVISAGCSGSLGAGECW